MNEYLKQLNDQKEEYNEFFEELRTYAIEFNVPIIQRDSLVLIQAINKMIGAKKMLEIGTAIGYSALSFVCDKKDLHVDTIERNPVMYEQAVKNIQKINKEDQINIIFGDALEIDEKTLGQYDVIFIDAAKAQYQKFFDKYSPLLNESGVILTDNIIFHGCVENDAELSKNVRNMVKKINLYNHYLNTLSNFETYYLDSGDGLAITVRKKYEINCWIKKYYCN